MQRFLTKCVGYGLFLVLSTQGYSFGKNLKADAVEAALVQNPLRQFAKVESCRDYDGSWSGVCHLQVGDTVITWNRQIDITQASCSDMEYFFSDGDDRSAGKIDQQIGSSNSSRDSVDHTYLSLRWQDDGDSLFISESFLSQEFLGGHQGQTQLIGAGSFVLEDQGHSGRIKETLRGHLFVAGQVVETVWNVNCSMEKQVRPVR